MPIFYDTNLPTPSTKNSITRTATDFGIRDFLLHRNIQNPIRYPQLSTSINGSPKGGEPFLDTMVGTGVVTQQVSLEVDGLLRYGNAIIMNRYKDTDSSAPSLFDIENIPAVPIFPTPPNGIDNYQQVDITEYGLLAKSNFGEYRKFNTIKNLYLDTPKQIDMADFVSLQPVLTAQQMSSYLDEYGDLNLGGRGTQTADIIGSILNGQGVGIGIGGLISNFDLRASLAGRVLGATGAINDTKLGIIGAKQLALALANNAAFNTQQEILGTFNIRENILSLVKDGNLAGFRPDYTITVGSTVGGRILNAAEKILGFEIPRSQVQSSGSIFQSENGAIGNIERANNLILNTGKGQVKALLANFTATLNGTSSSGYDSPDSPFNFFRSAYAPGFKDNRGRKMINPKGYVYMDGEGSIINFFDTGKKSPIADITFNRSKMIEKYGFIGTGNAYLYGSKSNVIAPDFSWIANTSQNSENLPVNANSNGREFIGEKKTLLSKTQKLFNSTGMKTIVSNKGDMTIGYPSQLQTAVVRGGISKGSAVLSSLSFNPDTSIKTPSTGQTADNTFCRSWTTYNRYSRIGNLIRQSGLNKSEFNETDIIPLGSHKGGWRQNIDGSILDDNGFVKIGPYKGDNLTRSATMPKKYMFSIENLAWAGTPAANLLPCEQGPGDLLTGKFGKIMWFPPYNLQFSESSSLNIESTNFIGRGEPVYTYNNTERTGQLSFSVIVDHPSIVNSFAGDDGPSDEFIRSWFAGCVDLDSKWAKKLTEEQRTKPNVEKRKIPKKKTITPAKVPDSIYIYFQNDITKINDEYENDDGKGIGVYVGEPQRRRPNGPLEAGDTWPDRTDFSLNKEPIFILDKPFASWSDANYIAELKTYLNSDNGCPTCKAKCVGYASSQGVSYYSNKLLAENRAKTLQDWLISNGILSENRIKTDVESKVLTGTYGQQTPVDEKGPKEDRYAKIIFFNDEKTKELDIEPEIVDIEQPIALNQQVKNRFYTECDFFEKIEKENPFVYETFKEKIRYFHPAFHSTTPEGFNSRLTFLLQCTRQGATISEIGPKNLAFGPAPVCILRIGDFYNTKIIMDNVSFDYEPLVWDLNPEGIGVQPMIANVTISFKYIGGSSLYGPINKLQNALSFNYFANTQTFDPRADTLAIKKDNNGNTVTRKTRYEQGEITDEPTYTLVPGMDPTTTSMGSLLADEISQDTVNNTNNPDQVKANDNTNKNTGLKDNNITSAYLSIVDYFSALTRFDFAIKKPASSNFTTDYDLTITLTNDSNPSESYTTKVMYPSESSGDYATSSSNKLLLSSNDSFRGVFDGNGVITEYVYAFKTLTTEMSPVFTGFSSGSSYTFKVDATSKVNSSNFSATFEPVSTTADTATTTFKDRTLELTYSVNSSSSTFLEDIHNAASNPSISNDFSDIVGEALRTYDNLAVKNVSMQSIYNPTTKNAITKLNCFVYKTTDGISYKHFDSRGAIGTLAEKTNTYTRFTILHNEIMATFSNKNIIMVGPVKEVRLNIDNVDYLYYQAFYQWTD